MAVGYEEIGHDKNGEEKAGGFKMEQKTQTMGKGEKKSMNSRKEQKSGGGAF